jgi:hypothetical protein
MCVLSFWLYPGRPSPLLVGANRDEDPGRPSAPPAEIEPGIWAGRDLRAGGTWLGFNRHGLFVALTNRRSPGPGELSRGLLALEALRCRKPGCVEGLLARRVEERPTAGFNLVAALEGEAVCIHWDGRFRPVRIPPGPHVLSSDHDLDDPALPEAAAFSRAFPPSSSDPPDPTALRAFLGSHEGARPVCKHGAGFGTVSSTIFSDGPEGPRMLHAAGPPCTTPHLPVALPNL